MRTLEHYMSLRYMTVTFFEDSCYMAYHPELPGCMAHGSTDKEAVENLKEARELYIGDMIARGMVVPAPRHLDHQVVDVARHIVIENPESQIWSVIPARKRIAEFSASDRNFYRYNIPEAAK